MSKTSGAGASNTRAFNTPRILYTNFLVQTGKISEDSLNFWRQI
jgi:hypothetical protein